jgi:hypothetical protein
VTNLAGRAWFAAGTRIANPSTVRPVEGPALIWKGHMARPKTILWIVLIGQLMVVLDATIVTVALPSISADLGFDSRSDVTYLPVIDMSISCEPVLTRQLPEG